MIQSDREQLRHWMGRTWVAEGNLNKLEEKLRERDTIIACQYSRLQAIKRSIDYALREVEQMKENGR